MSSIPKHLYVWVSASFCEDSQRILAELMFRETAGPNATLDVAPACLAAHRGAEVGAEWLEGLLFPVGKFEEEDLRPASEDEVRVVGCHEDGFWTWADILEVAREWGYYAKPKDSAEQPAEGVENPADSAEQPAEGVEQPAEGVENPAEGVEQSAE